MLTEVDSRHCVTDAVAASVADAEEARSLRRDATAMVERMAAQAHDAGLVHPVAAAVALAARVSQLTGPEEFAERIGVPITRLVEAEAGTVRFGDLPRAYDAVFAELGLELLGLADLEVALAGRGPAQAY